MTVKKMMYVLYSKTYLHCFKTDHGGDMILKEERNKEYKMVKYKAILQCHNIEEVILFILFTDPVLQREQFKKKIISLICL